MDVDDVLAWLGRRGTKRNVDGMARYGIVARRAFGVPMGTMRSLAKRIGRDHALAAALWKSGWHEARMLATRVADPARVTPAQMDAWAASFENWAQCDTACLQLFDRSPFAWGRVRPWASSPREFVRRGAFALMASLALHDKATPDARFEALLPLIAKGARDDRNFVKKGVSWALRSVGRRSRRLNGATRELARRLVSSEPAAARWVGRDALRELAGSRVQAHLAAREQRAAAAGQAAKRAAASAVAKANAPRRAPARPARPSRVRTAA
jgi:3-methyladenine DNA glycosylase AlkD